MNHPYNSPKMNCGFQELAQAPPFSVVPEKEIGEKIKQRLWFHVSLYKGLATMLCLVRISTALSFDYKSFFYKSPTIIDQRKRVSYKYKSPLTKAAHAGQTKRYLLETTDTKTGKNGIVDLSL